MSFWSKISGLNQDLLDKQGEEVSIITAVEESKIKKIGKPHKKEKKNTENWLPEESQGQLSVDIYEDDNDCLIIESMIAGGQAKDIDIITEPDLIIIRGTRSRTGEEDGQNYYYQECFWGKFSRTLILPFPIKPNEVKANFKNGILKITLPKAEETDSQKNIEVSD